MEDVRCPAAEALPWLDEKSFLPKKPDMFVRTPDLGEMRRRKSRPFTVGFLFLRVIMLWSGENGRVPSPTVLQNLPVAGAKKALEPWSPTFVWNEANKISLARSKDVV
jgi:hypothetical protein